jgi:hypothetical protein
MHSNALLSPRPVAPFQALSYKQLVDKVLSFESPKWNASRSGYSSSYQIHCCFDSTFASLFGMLNRGIAGLDIHSFIS